MFLIANSIAFFEPLVVAKLLNIIQEQGINSNSLPQIYITISLFLLITILFWIFHGPARVIETKNAFKIRANYKKYLIEGTMDLPAEWHADHHSGDTIDKIEKGTSALYNFSSRSFEVIEMMVRFISSYIALAYFNLHASYLIALITIITVFIILQFDKKLIIQYRELYKTENKISAKIFDAISNITTVIILRIEKLLLNNIMKKVLQPFKLFSKNMKLNETKWFIVSLLTSIMMVSVLGSFIWEEYSLGATIMIGTIYALYGYVQRITGLFYRFAYRYGDIVRQRTAVANAQEISNQFTNKDKKEQFPMNKWNKLVIKNLNFSYDDKKALNNINITINRKDRIALIGESGSGKTTFLKILRELYIPSHVEVELDNKKSSGFCRINNHISLIPQDPEIFNSTIKKNITFGINHSIKYIKKYTDMSCFTEVIERLPNKWNSKIVEKGVNLSGGEKQRLALARGLLASEDKEIILLDEPTSSVDSKNEMEIYMNIFRTFRNKTIISSVHRLHLLPYFDNIYFFKKGKIIASGRFDVLVNKSKEFKKLWDKYQATHK